MATQVFRAVFYSSWGSSQISPKAAFDDAAIPPPIFSMGGVKKCQNQIFKSIFYVKNHLNLSDFLLKNANSGAHFLLMTFFDSINFLISSFSKMMSDILQLVNVSILKIQ